MPRSPAEAIRMEARRVKVAELYLRGMRSLARIAQELGVDKAQISRDFKQIRKMWRETCIQDIHVAQQEELAKIDQIEQKAWLAWERSCQLVETMEVIGTAQGAKSKPEKVRKITKGQSGNPRFLQVVLDRPVGDWSLLAELVTGQRMDPGGGFASLEPKALVETWHILRTKYPGDFAVSSKEQLVWHDIQAVDCALAREWSPALFHLDQLVEAQPNSGEFLVRRAQAHIGLGQLGRAAADVVKARELKVDDRSSWQTIGHVYAELDNWKQAAAAFQRCREHHPSAIAVTFWHALALAAAGDDPSYRKACPELLETFGKTENAEIANDVARFCVLFADAVADIARPLEMAEKSVALRPNQYQCLNTLGAALYRSKRYCDSVQRFDEAIKVHGQGGTAADWLFLAMAHHRLGHVEEGKKWLTEAQKWIDQRTQENPNDGKAVTNPLPWEQRLELKLIRVEAETLMNNARATK